MFDQYQQDESFFWSLQILTYHKMVKKDLYHFIVMQRDIPLCSLLVRAHNKTLSEHMDAVYSWNLLEIDILMPSCASHMSKQLGYEWVTCDHHHSANAGHVKQSKLKITPWIQLHWLLLARLSKGRPT